MINHGGLELNGSACKQPESEQDSTLHHGTGWQKIVEGRLKPEIDHESCFHALNA